MDSPSIGVVLLNWNGYDDTAAALDSIIATSPRPAHVIVVDNGSHDNSVRRFHDWASDAGVDFRVMLADALHDAFSAPWLLIIDAQINRGFSIGNNIGLEYLYRQTNTSHFLLLNNDTVVEQDYFAQLITAIKYTPDVGLLGSAIYYEPERDRVWYAGGHEIPWRALILHDYDVPDDATPRPTTFITGCAMLIARSLYERLGGLAECYTPIYWEDGDYSRQAVAVGVPVLWAPKAVVYHKVGSSVGGERITPQVAYWQNRHRGYYVRRNYTGLDRWLALAYLCITKPGRAVVEVLRGHASMGRAIARGFAHGVFGRIP